jgi:AhpD family alkylhydroperoxidase
MQPRINNPVLTVPGAMEAMEAMANLGVATRNSGHPETTLFLVEARASQINGCSICLDMHTRELKLAGEPDQRIFMVAAWRESPYFSEAERAALALTEAATRLADRPDPVPDDVWAEAARHYSDEQLAGLVLAIAAINAWNRLNATTRQVSGDWVDQWVRRPQPAGRPS